MSAREGLPARRQSFSATFDAAQKGDWIVSWSVYPDGRMAEMFISGAKAGADTSAAVRDGAVLVSLALQHGAAPRTILHALTGDSRGEPASIVGRAVLAACRAAGVPLEGVAPEK